MSLKIDAVIKIGGSAVTNKEEKEMLKPGALQRVAECMRQCQESGITFVIVHGAGSFGHHHSREFEISKGLPSNGNEEETRKRMLGFSLTRQSVLKLNQLLINCLLEMKVPAVACSPGSSWVVNQKEPESWPREALARMLELGLVPVLHGDVCMDEMLGFCILSGDTVIKTLCSSFDVKRVVFLTDVAGIYDRPPNEPDSQLLPSICVGSDGKIQEEIGISQSQNDVTGGMRLKLTTALDIVTQSEGRCPVFVCAFDSPDASSVITSADLASRNMCCTKISLVK